MKKTNSDKTRLIAKMVSEFIKILACVPWGWCSNKVFKSMVLYLDQTEWSKGDM